MTRDPERTHAVAALLGAVLPLVGSILERRARARDLEREIADLRERVEALEAERDRRARVWRGFPWR